MGRNSKWIDSRPGESARRIVRRALGARLERMLHYLELAVCESPRETENVHQLRVFSRRTAAALEIFEDWLPPRRGKWMRKRVKQVRKTAGEARDLDVLLMRWMGRIEQMPSAPASLLLEHAKRRRRAAQKPIEAIHRKLVRKRFRRRMSTFTKRVRWRGDQLSCGEQFACIARVALGQLVVPYLEAAGDELADAEALHAFRIQGKQVRYAMEIFAGAFDAEFRTDLYPVVAALQERLGAINDHVTAEAYLVRWREETDSCALREAIDMGVQHERHGLELARQEFLDWWSSERREDLRRRFARYVQTEPTPQPPPTEDRAGVDR